MILRARPPQHSGEELQAKAFLVAERRREAEERESCCSAPRWSRGRPCSPVGSRRRAATSGPFARFDCRTRHESWARGETRGTPAHPTSAVLSLRWASRHHAKGDDLEMLCKPREIPLPTPGLTPEIPTQVLEDPAFLRAARGVDFRSIRLSISAASPSIALTAAMNSVIAGGCGRSRRDMNP